MEDLHTNVLALTHAQIGSTKTSIGSFNGHLQNIGTSQHIYELIIILFQVKTNFYMKKHIFLIFSSIWCENSFIFFKLDRVTNVLVSVHCGMAYNVINLTSQYCACFCIFNDVCGSLCFYGLCLLPLNISVNRKRSALALLK